MNSVPNTPFLTIRDASTVTGLSQYYLRNGCKAGIIPHICSGEKYMINLPELIRKLDAESRMATEAVS